MMRSAVITGLLFQLFSPLDRADAMDLSHRENGDVHTDKQDIKDRTREYACDCCQKCKAARRPQVEPEEQGPLEKNGCKDCCERCGRPVQPAPEEIPPEIIEKPRR